MSNVGSVHGAARENAGSEAITLLRAVIHQCHHALVSHSDLTVSGGSENSEMQTARTTESSMEGPQSHRTAQREAAAAAAKQESKYVSNEKKQVVS